MTIDELLALADTVTAKRGATAEESLIPSLVGEIIRLRGEVTALETQLDNLHFEIKYPGDDS